MWKRGYTTLKIIELRNSRKIDDDWLVCPSGDSGKAVPVMRFMENTNIFEQQAKTVTRQQSVGRQASTQRVGTHPLISLGIKTTLITIAMKVVGYIYVYCQLKSVASASRSFGSFKGTETPSLGFATFIQAINEHSTIFLIFGLAVLFAGLVLDRIEQTRAKELS